jgi:hypothetical protein
MNDGDAELIDILDPHFALADSISWSVHFWFLGDLMKG